MKKFIIIVLILVLLAMGGYYAYYHLGLYIDTDPSRGIEYFARVEGMDFCIDRGNGYEPVTIKGVDLGSGMPGQWSTEFMITEDMYSEWFREIKEMGANTIRVYTVQGEAFYNAFYKFNKDNPDPLWLIQGVWVNDYTQNSHVDAYDTKFIDEFEKNCTWMVDVVHGQKRLSTNEMESAGNGSFTHDISQWVIAYILGVEWEDVTVAYTNHIYADNESIKNFTGEYMLTSEDATPFEAMLARVGDTTIKFESQKYKTQRPIAFSNWPTTDPFEYPEDMTRHFMKCACVDVEHILCTGKFLPGQFASYHVYPYYPDYLAYITDWSTLSVDVADYITEGNAINTYQAYMAMLVKHHTMPVIISEFGVSTGRGVAQLDVNTNRNQGHMSEKDQGKALVDCYEDILKSGCIGGCIFTWQDEWFKRTWNTMHAVDLKRTPYWSDYQTNEQYFGVMSFDPGNDKCVSYVDGDTSEWKKKDIISENQGLTLSAKYDERFMYFYISGEDLDPENTKLYIPLDVTPKTGSSWCKNEDILFDRDADFLITIDGKENSNIKVQERYDALRSTHSVYTYGFDTYLKENIPQTDSPEFVDINLILQTETLLYKDNRRDRSETFPTGKLQYGNANPESDDFDSLADFIFCDNGIELKIPWQLMNFCDASLMKVHDDYYDGNYGIRDLEISSMYAGIARAGETGRIRMDEIELDAWNSKVTYHERLKPSYYEVQKLWTSPVEELRPEMKTIPSDVKIISVTQLDPYTTAVRYSASRGADHYHLLVKEPDRDRYTIEEIIDDETVCYYTSPVPYDASEHMFSIQAENEIGKSTMSEPRPGGYNAEPVFGVPVIMYHEFLRPEDVKKGVLFDEYAIWETEFEEDLKWIKENGYTTITTEEYAAALKGTGKLPDKPIIISIDDGKWGVYRVAYPLLQKYKMKASLSIICEQIDISSARPIGRESADAPYCTWDELVEMSNSGTIEMISHTYYRHYYMNDDGRTGANTKIGDTIESFLPTALIDYRMYVNTCEDYFGHAVKTLCYPYSKNTHMSDHVWRKCGYELLLCGDREDVRVSPINYNVLGGGLDYYSATARRIVRMNGDPLGEVMRRVYEGEY